MIDKIKVSVRILVLYFSFFPIKSYSQIRSNDMMLFLEKAKDLQRKDADSAIYYANEALVLANKSSDHWGAAKSNALIARAKNHLYGHYESTFHYMEALEELRQSDTTDFFLSYTLCTSLAVIQHDYGLYSEAGRYYDSAQSALLNHLRYHPDVASQYGDQRLLYRNKFFKALNESKAGNMDVAESILTDLLNEPKAPFSVKMNALNRVGNIFIEMGEEELGFGFLERILIEDTTKSIHVARAYHNLASAHFGLKNYNRAKSNLLKALSLSKKHGDTALLFYNLMDLGEVQTVLGAYENAKELLFQALDIDLKIEQNPDQYRIYRLLADALITIDPQASRDYLRKYDNVDETFKKSQTKLIVKNKQIAFQNSMSSYLEKKQQTSNNLRQREIYKRNLMGFIFISAILLILSIAWFLRKRQINRDKLFSDALEVVKRPRGIRSKTS